MPRNYKQEYERYHSRPEQRRRNAARKRARRKLEREGRVRPGDGKDVDHRDGNPNNNSRSNLRVKSASSNRSYARNRNAGKRNRSD